MLTPRYGYFGSFARFTKPILDVLNQLGISATLEGRNDLVVADGRKFSGNAIARYKDRILMHGTLLFNASMEDLSQALRVKERSHKRGVASRPSRVCNLSEFLPPILPRYVLWNCSGIT